MVFRATLSVLGGLCLSLVPASADAAMLHIDDFQSGTVEGWSGGDQRVNQPTGGPAGEGDRFLQIQATSPNGPGSRLAVFNDRPEWTGSLMDAGATRVTADLMNPISSPSLDVRLVLFGPTGTNNRWTSANSVTVPNDGLWHGYEFSLAQDALSRVQGSSTYDAMMADVRRVMLRHDGGSPSPTGEPISATLNIDNVRLVPEPSFPLVAVALTMGWLLGYSRQRNRGVRIR